MLKKCYVPCESPQEGVGVTTRGLRHLCLAGLGMRRAKQTSKCSICSYQLNIWYVAPSNYDIKLIFGRRRDALGLRSSRPGSAQYCSPSGNGPIQIQMNYQELLMWSQTWPPMPTCERQPPIDVRAVCCPCYVDGAVIHFFLNSQT